MIDINTPTKLDTQVDCVPQNPEHEHGDSREEAISKYVLPTKEGLARSFAFSKEI